jgi:hypothetical protein
MMRFARLAAAIGLCAALVACGEGSSVVSGCPTCGPHTVTSALSNGTLSAWQQLPAMPHPRANHCAVAVNGYLLVLGGNYLDPVSGNFVNVPTVDAAALLPDGTLGAWVQSPLPNPMSQCTAAAGNDSSLYIVDGLFDDDVHFGGRTWRGTVASDGTVGGWTLMGLLPRNIRILSDQAWVVGTNLVAMNSPIFPDGTGNSSGMELDLVNPGRGWTQRAWSPNFRGHALYALSGQRAYAFGGYTPDTNAVVTDSDAVPFVLDQIVGVGIPTTPLPQPTSFGDAVAVDGYIFVVGGKPAIFGAAGVPDTFAAPINGDGTLGAWAPAMALPQGRTDQRVTLGGSYLYVTGGGFDGPGVDTVFAAQVRF